MLLLVEQERLIAAGLAFEADAVEKARLGGLGHLLGALLLLDPGSVEAAAATLVQDLAVDLGRVPASKRGLERAKKQRHLGRPLSCKLFPELEKLGRNGFFFLSTLTSRGSYFKLSERMITEGVSLL